MESDMNTSQRSFRHWKTVVGISASGMLFASSCGSIELEAIVVGIDAAARHISDGQKADDISFGDWLLSELGDL